MPEFFRPDAEKRRFGLPVYLSGSLEDLPVLLFIFQLLFEMFDVVFVFDVADHQIIPVLCDNQVVGSVYDDLFPSRHINDTVMGIAEQHFTRTGRVVVFVFVA